MGKKMYKLGIMVVLCLLFFAGVMACSKNAIDSDNSEKGSEENVTNQDDSEYKEINFAGMRNLERESEKTVEVDFTACNLSFSPDGSRFVYYQASLWPMARLMDINGKEYTLLPLDTENASRGAVSWYDEHKPAYVSLSGFQIDPENLKSHVYLHDPDSGKTDIIESPVRLRDYIGVAMINAKGLLAMSREGLYQYSFEEEKWDMFTSIPNFAKGFLWSGDYSKVAYTTMPEPSRSINILETSTGQKNVITVDYPIKDYCWSHDGNRLALLCIDEEKNNYIITIIKPDGTEVYSKIIKGVNFVGSIKWVPNSEKINFWLEDDEGDHLRVVDLKNNLIYFDEKLSGGDQWAEFLWLSENCLVYIVHNGDSKPLVYIVNYKP